MKTTTKNKMNTKQPYGQIGNVNMYRRYCEHALKFEPRKDMWLAIDYALEKDVKYDE